MISGEALTQLLRCALLDVEQIAGGGELDYDHSVARERLRAIRERIAKARREAADR